MGATTGQIVLKVLLPESLPGMVAGHDASRSCP